ncbi:hypothetical protein QBC39DRAFT_344170 [Podospora conica]|nr:hypothetical protein QBC39DRAFT_344170 [Schizothecium conicum]
MWELSYPREKWPDFLWRVDDQHTQSIPHPTDTTSQLKLVASAATKTPGMSSDDMDLCLFLDHIAKHIVWSDRDKSYFLSVFTARSRAERWAEKRAEKPERTPVTIYKIDTAKLGPGVRLFDMKTLTELFKLDYKCFSDEVLFFGSIPRDAVVDVVDRLDLDTYDWGPEHHGQGMSTS